MASFVKNPKTGAILAATSILLKRPDLIPCDKDGRPVDAVGPGLEVHELLLNPVNGTVVAWREEMASIRGMVGVDNEAEAVAIMQQLERVAGATDKEAKVPKIEAAAVSQEDDEPDQTETEPASTPAPASGLELPAEAKDWDSKQLKQWAQDKLDEVLDARTNPDTMREQIQVLINNKNAEAAA